jgi:hypothetical protein
MIHKKETLNGIIWQTCLPFILLSVAGCSKTDSMASEQPSQARPVDSSPAPRPATETSSVAAPDGARNTRPTEGSSVTVRAPASKTRADITRTSHVKAPTRPYEGPIESRRPISRPSPPSSRVESSPKITGDGRESEIRFARFLIKAGLSPMAVEALREIIKQAPGTQAAREAHQALDSIAKAK